MEKWVKLSRFPSPLGYIYILSMTVAVSLLRRLDSILCPVLSFTGRPAIEIFPVRWISIIHTFAYWFATICRPCTHPRHFDNNHRLIVMMLIISITTHDNDWVLRCQSLCSRASARTHSQVTIFSAYNEILPRLGTTTLLGLFRGKKQRLLLP